MEKSVKPLATNLGLYLGSVLALATIVGYFDLDLMTNLWFGASLLIIVVVFGVISAIKSKILFDGFISLKDAFSSYFITVALGIVMSSIVSFMIFNIIDPDAALVLNDKIIDTQVKMMQDFGATENQITKTVEELEAKKNMFALGDLIKSIAFQLTGYSIVGLIVALVIKKNIPDQS